METNAAGQNLAQAVEDRFHRRLLDQGGGHIEQGSIPTLGGRHAYIIFRHVHQTSTDPFNREPQRICKPEKFTLTKNAPSATKAVVFQTADLSRNTQSELL
jgi:hypothetical protein